VGKHTSTGTLYLRANLSRFAVLFLVGNVEVYTRVRALSCAENLTLQPVGKRGASFEGFATIELSCSTFCCDACTIQPLLGEYRRGVCAAHEQLGSCSAAG